ncbi:MAG: hypothetical protein VXW65_04350 [Pseudomonadota bacterium]|nr:hypothetical protein [Pseudomonadota bacterium]
MRYLMLFTVCTIMLTGCFNDSNDSQGRTQPAPAQPDSFVVQVQRQVDIPKANADSLEAIQVSNIVETSPETDEPISIVF